MAKHSAQQKRSIGATVARIIGSFIGICLLVVAVFLAFMSYSEYTPANQEKLSPSGSATQTITTDEEFTLLSWNVGYGALGNNADFFMDGGTGVITATEERVLQNIADVCLELSQVNPEVALFQEVDSNSARSSHINQVQLLSDAAPNMQAYYAINYKTPFVPLGIPPYGSIEGGLVTLTSLADSTATREALPCSYTWPLSTMQLKRCELVLRIPVEGSEHELVIINEHPDAYTDEEHHAIQIAAILETLQTEAAKGNWVIAGGDWNHVFSNVDTSNYPLLDENNWAPGLISQEDLGDAWQLIADSSVPTCRLLDHPLVNENGDPLEEITQYYVIDGFIVSSNVDVASIETQNLGFIASDHNPVVMKVLLRND